MRTPLRHDSMFKPHDRKKIIEAYESGPKRSIAAIIRETRHCRNSVCKVLSEYKAGRLDRDGFVYVKPLVDFDFAGSGRRR